MLYTSILVGSVAIASYWIDWSLAVSPKRFHIGERATGSLDSFIASESPIALQGVLNNIGGVGSEAVGVDPGLVIASPSRANPDCESSAFVALEYLCCGIFHYSYNWSRDMRTPTPGL